jgi:hypothetical protein
VVASVPGGATIRPSAQDARWARIEQILPTLATKADLEVLRQEFTERNETTERNLRQETRERQS